MSGISRTDQTISQVWYPSYGYFSRNGGVLTAAYASGQQGIDLGNLSPADRIALTIKQASADPSAIAEPIITSGFSVRRGKRRRTIMGAWVA